MKKIGFADEIHRLRSEGYSYNKIRGILKCSKGTISKYAAGIMSTKYNVRIFKTQEELDKLHCYAESHTYQETANYFNVSVSTIRNYTTCKKISRNKQSHEKTLVHYKTHKQQLRLEIKKQCVEYLGGQCKICGYKKCYRALEFHHMNPAEKEMGISQANTKYRFEQLKPELDKCVLLCKNCHAEVHDGLIEI